MNARNRFRHAPPNRTMSSKGLLVGTILLVGVSGAIVLIVAGVPIQVSVLLLIQLPPNDHFLSPCS